MPKKIFFILLILITFNGCQSVKDGLTGKKQTNTDEFLIEKKNPLVLPIEFNKLPEPRAKIKDSEKEIDLESILSKKTITKNSNSKKNNSSRSIEKSILEKIKNN